MNEYPQYDIKLIAEEIFDVNDRVSVAVRCNFNPLDVTSSFRLKLVGVSIHTRWELLR